MAVELFLTRNNRMKISVWYLSEKRQSISLEDAEDILMENTGVLPKSSSSIVHSICDVLFYIVMMCVLTFAGFLLEFYVFSYR